MLTVVSLFLFISVFLYTLLGGADYGIGIIELYSSPRNRNKTKKAAYRVIGPVWEVNHIWLIITIVILWVGFPGVFNVLMVHLHIPITLALIGIICRGVAFVFRHYDAVIDNSQKIYDLIFEWSSVLTPMVLGICFGSLLAGQIPIIDDLSSLNFYQLYVAPWFNLFSFSVGFFFTGLCAFNSAVFMVGETSDEQQRRYIKKAQKANIVMLIAGVGTLLTGAVNPDTFVHTLIHNLWYSIGLFVIAIVAQLVIWRNLGKGRKVRVRFLAGVFLLILLIIPLSGLYPNIIHTSKSLSLIAEAAPPKVIDNLAISLLTGSVFIIPGLIHLLKSFGMLKVFDENQPE